MSSFNVVAVVQHILYLETPVAVEDPTLLCFGFDADLTLARNL